MSKQPRTVITTPCHSAHDLLVFLQSVKEELGIQLHAVNVEFAGFSIMSKASLVKSYLSDGSDVHDVIVE